jgi:hypothetical protein
LPLGPGTVPKEDFQISGTVGRVPSRGADEL